MSSVLSVLIADHLPGGDQSLKKLSQAVDIPVERLHDLETGTPPRMIEVAMIAEYLDIAPIHLFRPAPSVQARRAGDGDTPQLSRLLDEVDSFIGTYAEDLRPNVSEAFSAQRFSHARAHGSSWGARNGIRVFSMEEDPLLRAVEQTLSVPVLIWPIANAPAGATLDFSGTVGIWVNSYDQSGARQRFTLAHEVAHILLKHVDTGRGTLIVDLARDVDRPEARDEKLAGAFAGAALADHGAVKEHWLEEETPGAVARVAAALGLSYQAALIALEREGFISRPALQQLEGVSVRTAFETGGVLPFYEFFEDQRNRRRLPQILPQVHHLERALERNLV